MGNVLNGENSVSDYQNIMEWHIGKLISTDLFLCSQTKDFITEAIFYTSMIDIFFLWEQAMKWLKAHDLLAPLKAGFLQFEQVMGS